MRLTPTEIRAIKQSVHEMDPGAEVYLFGSRVDDAKRGGDIDLLVFSQTFTQEHRSELRSRLFELLDEQKIDIVIAKDSRRPFVRLALAQAHKL